MTIKIRKAEDDDVPSLLFIGKKMHLESRYKAYDFDSEKCIKLLNKLTEAPSGIVLVAVFKDEVIGMFVGNVFEHFFGRSLASGDLIFYILPEHRCSKAGRLLLREYIRCAKSMNVDDIRIGNSTGIMPKRIIKFYESNGFINVGGNFTFQG